MVAPKTFFEIQKKKKSTSKAAKTPQDCQKHNGEERRAVQKHFISNDCSKRRKRKKKKFKKKDKVDRSPLLQQP
jgi:hypothetical protein